MVRLMVQDPTSHSSFVHNRSLVNSRGLIKGTRRLDGRSPPAGAEYTQPRYARRDGGWTPPRSLRATGQVQSAGSHFISRPLSSLGPRR